MRGAIALSVLGLTCICLPGRAAAQDVSEEQEALGQRHFRDGVASARAGSWNEARQSFERAYELTRDPMVLINLGAAQVETGQLVEALASYRRFLRLGTEGRAVEHRDPVRESLDVVEARLAFVRVSVPGLQSSDRLVLDDGPLDHAVVDDELPMNPGSHELAVERAERTVAHREFDAEAGEHLEISLRVPLPDGDGTPIEDEIQEDESTVWESPWLWLTLGVLAAGAATVTVLVLTAPDFTDGNLSPGHFEFQ